MSGGVYRQSNSSMAGSRGPGKVFHPQRRCRRRRLRSARNSSLDLVGHKRDERRNDDRERLSDAALVEDPGGAPIQLAYCWAHCRRRLREIYDSGGSEIAAEGLRRIAELYAIEADIRGNPPERRLAERQARSASASLPSPASARSSPMSPVTGTASRSSSPTGASRWTATVSRISPGPLP